MLTGMLLIIGLVVMSIIAVFIKASAERGQRRDHADWLARRKESAKAAVAEAKAAYDAQFSDPRDPSPEARKMRSAISKARKALKQVTKEERHFANPSRTLARADTSDEDRRTKFDDEEDWEWHERHGRYNHLE